MAATLRELRGRIRSAGAIKKITKAQEMAASDPALVREEEPKWIPTLSPKIANVMAQGTYDTTVSLTRLQRVADVMEDYGFLPKSFNSQLPAMIALPAGA